jgi:hypothetical protein
MPYEMKLPQAPLHHAQRCFNISLPSAQESEPLTFCSKGESIKLEKGGGAKKKKEKKEEKNKKKTSPMICFIFVCGVVLNSISLPQSYPPKFHN